MSSKRYHAIDKLRALMILVVMFGHALLPYLTVPRKYHDPQTSLAVDVIAIFLYSFAMDLFFVTAGFSAALLAEKRGIRGLLRNRRQRILVPFVAAYLVLAPITRAAYQYARETASTQSIQAGIDVVMRGEWLMWRKPYHLWFLVALLIFTWIAVGGRQLLLRFAPRAAERIVAAARSLLASRWRAALVALVIAPTTITGYLHGNGNIRMPLLGVTMLLFFVLGWLLYRHRDLLPTLGDRAWRLIAIAVLVTPATVWGSRLRLIWQDDTPLTAGVVAGVGNTILAACMTLGLLGLFQARLDRPSAAWRYISDASYWIYLIHLPLVIAVSATWSVTPYPAGVKYLLTIAVVVPIVMASYHFGVRHTAFGDKRKAAVKA